MAVSNEVVCQQTCLLLSCELRVSPCAVVCVKRHTATCCCGVVAKVSEKRASLNFWIRLIAKKLMVGNTDHTRPSEMQANSSRTQLLTSIARTQIYLENIFRNFP